MKAVGLGVAAAVALFPWVFRARGEGFWTRMPIVAGGLGVLALVAHPELRRQTPTSFDLVTGVASAAGLYGIFHLGDRFARRYLPTGEADLTQIYELQRGAPRWLVAMLLAGLIAPSEELFWRGLVQDTFTKRYGFARGSIAAATCYAGAHLGSRNLTLTGAAGLAGTYWGLHYAIQRRLPAVIVSHIVFDLWAFFVPPTSGVRPMGDTPL